MRRFLPVLITALSLLTLTLVHTDQCYETGGRVGCATPEVIAGSTTPTVFATETTCGASPDYPYCAPIVSPPSAPTPTQDLCYQTGGRFGCLR